ncbi:unnamed protein product [Closterium sp. Naga37s-1]|nr:unnamed protein product [Closterium sp. Naga37s-1]
MTVQFAASVTVSSEVVEGGAPQNTPASPADSWRGDNAEAEAAAGGLGTAAAVAVSSGAFEAGICQSPPLSETIQAAFDRGAPEEAAGRVGGIGREQMEEEASGRFPGDDLCGSVEERELFAWKGPGSSALPLRQALLASLGTITTISLILILSAALALTLPVLLSSLISSLPSLPFLSTSSQYSSSQSSSSQSSSSQFSSSTSPSGDDRRLMPASASLTLTRVLALVCVTPLLAFFTRYMFPRPFSYNFHRKFSCVALIE